MRSCYLFGVLFFALSAHADRFEPIYPAVAIEKGIEGWVELDYWVNDVCEFVAKVVESDPKGVFEDAAIKNLERTLVHDEEIVDWSQITAASRLESGTEPLSQSDHEIIHGEIEAKGPWPMIRTILNIDSSNKELRCWFSPDGSLERIEYPGVTQANAASGREGTNGLLLAKRRQRFSFLLGD